MKRFILVLLIVSSIFVIAAKKPKEAGITGYELLRDFRSISAGEIVDFSIPCSGDKMVLGGGVKGPSEWNARVYVNAPDDGGDAWLFRIHNATSSVKSFSSYVICADVIQ